jgi:hypothetical protein
MKKVLRAGVMTEIKWSESLDRFVFADTGLPIRESASGKSTRIEEINEQCLGDGWTYDPNWQGKRTGKQTKQKLVESCRATGMSLQEAQIFAGVYDSELAKAILKNPEVTAPDFSDLCAALGSKGRW